MNTKELRSMQSMGEAVYIHCRMAHSQLEYYLFVNVLITRKALKQEIPYIKCCIHVLCVLLSMHSQNYSSPKYTYII